MHLVGFLSSRFTHDARSQEHKAYNYIYNDTKWNRKNMKECDKRKSHANSKFHMICISCNNDRQPVTRTFTALHHISPHFTQLQYLSVSITSLHHDVRYMLHHICCFLHHVALYYNFYTRKYFVPTETSSPCRGSSVQPSH